MIETGTLLLGKALDGRKPLRTFSLDVLILAVALTWASNHLLSTSLWVLSGFMICIVLAGRGLVTHYPHQEFGVCNTVTLVRAAFLSILFGILFEIEAVSPWLVFWLALIALSLDGFDGWLARRAGLQSDFGARFDMETDAALGAVLALWLMLSGTTGPEILILGFMRYGFVAAGWICPKLTGDLPVSFRRKTICVVQIAALIILICPLVPVVLIAPVSLVAASLLVYSFAIDTLWLLRNT